MDSDRAETWLEVDLDVTATRSGAGDREGGRGPAGRAPQSDARPQPVGAAQAGGPGGPSGQEALRGRQGGRQGAGMVLCRRALGSVLFSFLSAGVHRPCHPC